jgi:hypothetical protein
MRRKWLYLGLVVLVGIIVAAGVWARGRWSRFSGQHQRSPEAGSGMRQNWGSQGPGQPGARSNGPRGPGANLTPEQQEQLRALRQQMQQQGATPQQIRDAVRQKFQSWGIQMPQRPMGAGRGIGGRARR